MTVAHVWIVTPLIINTSTQQAPYTGHRARCAASTAPNTRGGTRESTAACGRRPGPQRSCRCSRSGGRHCETGSRGTNRPRVRPAAPPQPPLGCAAFCTGSCTRDRASSGAANRCPGSGDPPSALAGGSRWSPAAWQRLTVPPGSTWRTRSLLLAPSMLCLPSRDEKRAE